MSLALRTILCHRLQGLKLTFFKIVQTGNPSQVFDYLYSSPLKRKKRMATIGNKMSFVFIGDVPLLLLISGDNSRAGNSQANPDDSRVWIVSPISCNT